MSYSINRVTTIAECDLLLIEAGKERAELQFKKLSEERLTGKYATSSIEIEAILQGVLVELSAINTIIDVLPEGPTKVEEIKKKVKLEYRKFLLEDRKESYGAVSLLEKELDLARVEQQLTEVAAFIDLITNHKATL